jgi:hypothetical protein
MELEQKKSENIFVAPPYRRLLFAVFYLLLSFSNFFLISAFIVYSTARRYSPARTEAD